MLEPRLFALLLTVLLLAVTTYFLLGSIPLLLLKHDNPIDGRFIRAFYITYFRIAISVAVTTVLSYWMASRFTLALGASGVTLLTLFLRGRLIPMMDRLNAQIYDRHVVAIPEFRKVHKSAIHINVLQLLMILGGLGAI
jgi:hypothetical protein